MSLDRNSHQTLYAAMSYLIQLKHAARLTLAAVEKLPGSVTLPEARAADFIAKYAVSHIEKLMKQEGLLL